MPADPRTAMRKYADAVSISPGDSTLWTSLARAALAIKPANSTDEGDLRKAASSAAYNAYLASRTTDERATALAVLAPALEKRERLSPDGNRWRTSMRYRLTNASNRPVTVIVRQDGLWGDTRIASESLKSERSSADAAVWRVPVPANGEASLTAVFDSRY